VPGLHRHNPSLGLQHGLVDRCGEGQFLKVEINEPSLDDVFAEATGHRLEGAKA
jgi:hypothetical protein